MKHLRSIAVMTVIFMCFAFHSQAQVAINNSGTAPHASAMLDVESTSLGLLVPRLTTSARLTLASTATAGLIVFDTDLNKFYLFNGTLWEDVSVGNLWYRSGTNTLLSNSNDYVGIGTAAPARKFEISGGSHPMRLTSSGIGVLLEFLSTSSTNWAIGTWSTNMRIVNSTDNFGSIQDQFVFDENYFSAWDDDTKTLGTLSNKWSNLYSIDGIFTGDVGIGTTTPVRTLEVSSSSSRPLRLTSSSIGSQIELLSTSTTNWKIGSWSSTFRIISSADNFTTTQDEYIFSTSAFMPWDDNTKTLGNNIHAWSHIYGVDGTFEGDVGIGVAAPDRTLEVRGPWKTARISSTDHGSTLEFVSTTDDDWAITTWYDQMVLLYSSNDFASKTDEYYFTTTEFRPYASGTKTLGLSSKEWSNIYSIDGAFTGEVGIGLQSPMGQLQVHEADNGTGTIYFTSGSINDSTRILFGEGSSATYGMFWLYDGQEDDLEAWGKSGSTLYGPHLAIERNNGYVAIGDDEYASGYMLSVHGDVICEELRVELVADWPDYVFKRDYDLMTIPELNRYIYEHGHLPDVPPAEEIENGGFEVGEMQKIMMKKIEELSLYIIKQQEEIESLKQELNKIKK